MKPRVAIVQLLPVAGGSQNLWVHAFCDRRFAGVEKHAIIPAGGETRLSPEERRWIMSGTARRIDPCLAAGAH